MNTFGYYDPTSVLKAVGIMEDKPERASSRAGRRCSRR
jgi:hypothetical protein